MNLKYLAHLIFQESLQCYGNHIVTYFIYVALFSMNVHNDLSCQLALLCLTLLITQHKINCYSNKDCGIHMVTGH